MQTNAAVPLHSISIDLSHSSESKELMMIVKGRLSWLSSSSDEFQFLHPIFEQLLEATKLLESLEEL